MIFNRAGHIANDHTTDIQGVPGFLGLVELAGEGAGLEAEDALVECGEYASAQACLADCAVVLGDCSSQESGAITACVEQGDTSDCGALATCIDAVACTEE